MQKVTVVAPPQGARIASTSGSVVLMAPGEKKTMNAARASRYAQAGCYILATDESEAPKGFEKQSDEERAARIHAAIAQLVEEGNPEDFTEGGDPRVASVSGRTGFRVYAGEIAPIFNEVLKAQDDAGASIG